MDNAEFDAGYRVRSKYSFWAKDQVRFSDLDALGHVSSVRTNEFFANARTQLFRKAIPEWPLSKQIPILKINAVRHESEIGYPQQLETGLFVEKFGNTSVNLVMGLFGNNDCLALCRNVFVFIDRFTRQAVIPSGDINESFLKIAS